jgi:hypothetical protein
VNRPNFFIIGAPKCGTTALSEYLRTHPNIFLSDPKEPHFFSDDMNAHRYVTTLETYLDLFKSAKPEHDVIGEASVGYLFSSVALDNIYEFNPTAKVIAMVRNPIDMAPSLHRQLLYARYETEPDFEKAWNLQEDRRNGRHIPPGCRAPAFLQYADSCFLGKQIQRLLNVFPDNQVMIVVFDDFIMDPSKVYREVLQFLGLPDDYRENFERINEAKQYRSGHFANLIAACKPLAVTFALELRAHTGFNLLPWMRRLVKMNEGKAEKSNLSSRFINILADSFRDDIGLLSSLLKRDLSSWLKIHDH